MAECPNAAIQQVFFWHSQTGDEAIVGHLDAFSIKIKYTPAAHAKHRNQTNKPNTTNTQHPQQTERRHVH